MSKDKVINDFVECKMDFYRKEFNIGEALLRDILSQLFESVGFVPIPDILKKIDSNMGQIEHHKNSDFIRAYDYERSAITLVELLEVHNCGSTGGFDRGQQPPERLDTPFREGQVPSFGGDKEPIKTPEDFITLKGRIKWLKRERTIPKKPHDS